MSEKTMEIPQISINLPAQNKSLLPSVVETETDNLHIAGKVTMKNPVTGLEETNIFVSPTTPTFEPKKLNEFMHSLDFSGFSVEYQDNEVTPLESMYLGKIRFSVKQGIEDPIIPTGEKPIIKNFVVTVYPDDSTANLVYRFFKKEIEVLDPKVKLDLTNGLDKLTPEQLKKIKRMYQPKQP